MADLLSLETYDPNTLIDEVIIKLGIRNDAGLSRKLEVAPPVISKIRRKHLAVGAVMLISIHEATGWEIKDIRKKMGDTRKSFSNL